MAEPVVVSELPSSPDAKRAGSKPALLFSNADSQVFPRPRMRVGEVGNCDIGGAVRASRSPRSRDSELVPLLFPVVGLVVVAVALPEAGLVVVEELEAP